MHIKYRPRNFDEVIGNEAVINALKQRKDSRPILFQGQRGSGKTMFGHIVADNFGASKENIIVVNCREQSGVSYMRTLLDSLFSTSLFGSKKVVILDEIHHASIPAMGIWDVPLDGEAQDRLPDTIQVIACTTDPQKLEPAFYDRFKKYTVRPLSDKDSLKLILYVADKEGIKLHNWAKSLLVEVSEGNPRRLLIGLDTIRNCGNSDQAEQLLEVLKIEDDKDLIGLFDVLRQEQKWVTVRGVLKSLLKSKSPNEIRIGLMNIISSNMMSNFYKTENSKILDILFDNLNKANGIPEKAQLINALHRSGL